MVVNNNANEVLVSFANSDLTKNIYKAAKLGVENDNIVITSVMLQNLMSLLFVALAKSVTLDDADFVDAQNAQKADSVKKFVAGADKRFGVGLDFACNYVLKDKRTWFKMQSLSINENANTIKYLEDKPLEDIPADEIVMVYNMFVTKLNNIFNVEELNTIKL